jgi:hypothetical protein
MVTKEQRRSLEPIDYGDGSIFCPICHLTYHDGRTHTAYHKKMMRIYQPISDPRLASFSPQSQDVRVSSQSDYLLNQLVYERARALRGEEGYDFTQWPEPRKPIRYRGRWLQLKDFDHQPNWHAWLLIEPDYVPIGVAGFNWMEWKNARAGWHLCFVWIAQSYRRKGMLTKRWPAFIQKYGWFTIETPISPAMEAFLFKIRHRTDR